MDTNGAAIRFDKVSKSFAGPKGRNVILEEASFAIPRGMTTVIAGGSGQGKSVILKMILGLLRPESGAILIEGRDVTKMGTSELRNLRTDFGVLFQGAALFDSLSVYENVALPLRERTKLDPEQIRVRVMASLDQLELSGHEQKYPAQLSGGMRKRVGLARALQLEPKIVLFDEPTTGLDPVMSQEIYHLFQRTQQRLGYTAVIVSHDIPKVFELADRLIFLQKGEVDLFDSPWEIRRSTKPAIRRFVEITMNETNKYSPEQSHVAE